MGVLTGRVNNKFPFWKFIVWDICPSFRNYRLCFHFFVFMELRYQIRPFASRLMTVPEKLWATGRALKQFRWQNI
jgi:hypothetical protein